MVRTVAGSRPARVSDRSAPTPRRLRLGSRLLLQERSRREHDVSVVDQHDALDLYAVLGLLAHNDPTVEERVHLRLAVRPRVRGPQYDIYLDDVLVRYALRAGGGLASEQK